MAEAITQSIFSQPIPGRQVKRTDFQAGTTPSSTPRWTRSRAGWRKRPVRRPWTALAAEVEKPPGGAGGRPGGIKIAVGTYTGTRNVRRQPTMHWIFTPCTGAGASTEYLVRADRPRRPDEMPDPDRGRQRPTATTPTDILVDTENLITWTGKRVSWYGESASVQMNEGGVLYTYFALG